jgi:aconitate hydratase
MEPRFRGAKAIIVRSFARIHEANLKKQGVLALTFAEPEIYDVIGEDDRISIVGLADLEPGKPVECVLIQPDGTRITFWGNQTLSREPVARNRAGSALNSIRSRTA